MLYVDIKQSYTPVKAMFQKALKVFNIPSLVNSIKENEAKLQQSDVWSNPDLSSKIAHEVKEDKDNLEKINRWKGFVSDIETFFELYEETKDEDVLVELDNVIRCLKSELEIWEVESTLSGEYDKSDAIINCNVWFASTLYVAICAFVSV